jgi:hypothetical protein
MHIRNLHLLNLLVEDAFPSSDKRLPPSRIASATPLTLSNPNEDLLQALAKFVSHPNTSLDFSLLQYISVENPDSDDCPLPHGLADIIRQSSKNLESSSHGPHSLVRVILPHTPRPHQLTKTSQAHTSLQFWRTWTFLDC